jgi:outer membrane protein TolC
LYISRLLSFGRVSELDLFKIDIALNDNVSRLYTLEKQYEATMMQLGAALGVSSARKAKEMDLDIFKTFHFESSESSSRKDLQALDLKMKSLDLKLESISFSRLPEVSIIGSYNWESPSAFTPNDFSVVGIEVSWGIWSSNERSFQKTKINHLKNSLEYSRQDLKNSIESEKKFYQANLLRLLNEWPQKESDFKRSREIVKLENTRYYKGKSSLNELLDAEILYAFVILDLLCLVYLRIVGIYFCP